MATRTKKIEDPGKILAPEVVLDTFSKELTLYESATLPTTLDHVLFAHLAIVLTVQEALDALEGFRATFVDWNEVRISEPEEIQAVLTAAENPLELAAQIKAFLNRLFFECHHVGVDFLREKKTTEIRSFFRKNSGLSDATVGLVSLLLNNYDLLPLDSTAYAMAVRLGWTEPGATPLQKQKDLFALFPPDRLAAVSAILNRLGRTSCRTEEEDLGCPSCVVRQACPFPRKARAKKATKKTQSATEKKTTKKKTKKKS